LTTPCKTRPTDGIWLRNVADLRREQTAGDPVTPPRCRPIGADRAPSRGRRKVEAHRVTCRRSEAVTVE